MRPAVVELADGGTALRIKVPRIAGGEPGGRGQGRAERRRAARQDYGQKVSQGTGPLALGAQSRGLLGDQRWSLATSLFSQRVQSDQ